MGFRRGKVFPEGGDYRPLRLLPLAASTLSPFCRCATSAPHFVTYGDISPRRGGESFPAGGSLSQRGSLSPSPSAPVGRIHLVPFLSLRDIFPRPGEVFQRERQEALPECPWLLPFKRVARNAPGMLLAPPLGELARKRLRGREPLLHWPGRCKKGSPFGGAAERSEAERVPARKNALDLTNYCKSFILEVQKALALQTASSLPDCQFSKRKMTALIGS